MMASYIEEHAQEMTQGKTVLELGAGAGLPGLVAARSGASQVIITDYPDADLIENLAYNIETSQQPSRPPRNTVAQRYLWGSHVGPLLAHLPDPNRGFDVLLLADLLFNHHCHEALVSTVLKTLARVPSALALVFFTPYRPWLLDKDLAFFDLCKENGLSVLELVRIEVDKVMFEEDRGDELLRRTIFGYELRWKEFDKQKAEGL